MRKKVEFEIVTLNWAKIENDKVGSLDGILGIYQIYGTSPLYGVDTLLYIGKSTNLKDRLSKHIRDGESSIGRQPNKSVRFAPLPSEFLATKELSSVILTIIEETLIIMYKPSFNSDSLNNIYREATTSPIYIQNHGDRGMLNYENTNYYFLDKSLTRAVITDNA